MAVRAAILLVAVTAVASNPPPHRASDRGPHGPHSIHDHHVDPFHAMPAPRCHGWGRSHPGELCPTDPVCAASVTRFATAKRHAPPRVAVLLRWHKRSAEATGGPREECYVPRRAEREYVPGV